MKRTKNNSRQDQQYTTKRKIKRYWRKKGNWNNPQRSGKGIEDMDIRRQVEIILTTALLRSVRILRIFLET